MLVGWFFSNNGKVQRKEKKINETTPLMGQAWNDELMEAFRLVKVSLQVLKRLDMKPLRTAQDSTV